jgi:raffinose/stachyose/melibiose transport system permease protein
MKTGVLRLPSRFSFRPRPRTVITVVLLALVSFLWVYPFLWMLSASLKEPKEIFIAGLNLIPLKLVWENYTRAWVTARFSTYMFNTIFITVGTVALVVLRTSLIGYVIGRYSFIGKRILVGLLLLTLFVPQGYTIIPIVKLSNELGLLNSLWGIVFAMGGGAYVAEVLLFSGFFAKIPKEMEEAAVLDGASFIDIFARIMMPLAMPIVATVVIMTFISSWNSFFLPLVFTFSRPDLRTLSVGMYAFVGEHETDWSGMAAAATISLVPVITLFFFMQRYFIQGLAGAVKE